MKINIHNNLNSTLAYQELKEVFNNFNFSEKVCGKGRIKKQASGNCHYAEVKISLEIDPVSTNRMLIWDVEEESIPTLYLDPILTTIKHVYDKWNKHSLIVTITGGSYHPIDSSCRDFEIATFLALANAIDFKNDFTKLHDY